MAGQKQVIKIDDSDSEWDEMPVLLPEQSLPAALPEQIPPVLLQEEIPPALLPEQTLVIPVDGMDQTKFTMPSPTWFKGKPAKEVRDAEEKEFEKWVAEGAGTQLPVDNTSACSKNLGLRYAASSGLAQSPVSSSQLPPPSGV